MTSKFDRPNQEESDSNLEECETFGQSDTDLVKEKGAMLDSAQDDGKVDGKVSIEIGAISALRYRIRDNPPLFIIIMGALQHIVLCFSGCLTTSSVVADVACVAYDHPVRSQLFCTTLFMVGFCTILQTAFGVRLPIFQGPSSSFLVPLLALRTDPSWACGSLIKNSPNDVESNLNTTMAPNTSTTATSDEPLGVYARLQLMSGSLILASLFEVVMGAFGLLGLLLRFIGPITVACTISLIGVSLFRLPVIYGRPNYPIAIGCTALVLMFVLYLKNVPIPLPRLGKEKKSSKRPSFPLFQLLPILVAVAVVWILSWILTLCGVFTDDRNAVEYLARADAKADIITRSPWFQITYPGQFGTPAFSTALTLGFLVACLSSLVESVGDYYAAREACEVLSPPSHAISRGILVEGLGSVISGCVGAGHATTSYSGNIAVLTLSQTACRVLMYAAGVMLICVSMLGKVGASFTTIPNPVLGGIMMVVIGSLVSIGFSNLKHVDMTSSRNQLVVGVPFMAGLVIPEALEVYPNLIQTGVGEIDRVITIILATPMFFGGMLALILDNTVPGTKESRGLVVIEEKEGLILTHPHEDASIYSWSFYPRLAKAFPCLTYFPFMPDVRTSSDDAVSINKTDN